METPNLVLKPFEFSFDTRTQLEIAVEAMMRDIADASFPEPEPQIGPDEMDFDDHVRQTPERVVKAFTELMSGVGQNAASALSTLFPSSLNEMINICDIDFVSLCMHHLLPFSGVVHFAYIPDKKIVGLSKIPRMIDILSHRPQVQENLTQQIVNTFQAVVEPLGCAAIVEAHHGCVSLRGACKPGIIMRTVALTGIFLQKPEVKNEFLLMTRGEK